MKRQVLAVLLAMMVSTSAMPVMAAEIVPDAMPAVEAESMSDEMEEAVNDQEAEIAEETEITDLFDEGTEEVVATEVDLKQVSAGGATYAFVNLSDAAEKETSVYKLTVSGRNGTTVTYYNFEDLKHLPGSEYYYIVTAGKDLAGETVYAYTGENAGSQTYSQFYSSLGVDTDNAKYDGISSATNFTGSHAKDISGTVVYGTNSEGNKVIEGIAKGRAVEAIDATSYITALMLSADGAELTEEQTALAAKKLKQNPTSSGQEGVKSVALASAAYTTSRYGIGEFAIVPDDTVAGYVWSEYWDNICGATISDGKTTTGAVHWIDLYGEAATSGAHYNKIELALNSGTALASNAAFVDRFDSFIKDGELNPGKYTITIYADGYENLTATVVNVGNSSITLANKTVVYSGKKADLKAEVTGSTGEVSYTYYSDEACENVLPKAPISAGTYYVVASVEADEVYGGATSEPAKLVIQKAPSTITLKAKTVTFTGKAQSIGKATVTGSTGKVAYTYYSDSSCKKALKSTPVNAGTYYVKATVAASGNYKAATSKAVKLVINKKSASISTKKLTATYKVANVKKAAKTYSLGASTTSKGKLTYKKVSGSTKITVDKAGKIKIAKKTAKGTYTAKIKITSASTTNYKSASKTVTVKVIVK